MRPVANLCASYVKLWEVKREVRSRLGMGPLDVEYAPEVLRAREVFQKWFLAFDGAPTSATAVIYEIMCRLPV